MAEALLPPDEAARWLAAILESLDDAIVGKAADGTIVSWNAAAERLYGYSAAEATGAPFSMLVPADRRAELEWIDAHVEAGERLEFETRQRRKDGDEVEVSLTVSPIRDTHGGIAGVWAIARNIGDRLRSEARLRRSEESYRLLFDRHPGPMWVYDPATHRFLAVNEAAIEAYGYSREEFLTMTIDDIRPPEEVPALHERLRSPDLDRGLVDSGVWRHRRKGGSLIDMEIVTSAIEFNGRRARLVLARDVTEHRRVEEQLSQVQRLDAIGSLAGGIAHDFNNLLMVAQLAADELGEELTGAPARHNLGLIEGAIARGTGLTRQLLAFSRRQVIHPQRTAVNDVVQDTLELLERVIGEDIQLVRQLAPDVPPILVDQSQLGQVILNVAINAREAMPQGGTLTIRTSALELDQAYAQEHLQVTPGYYALLQITDTGLGMDDETRNHAFEPFFTTKAHGTGFGLATVYGIVKQSDGHIWLYSEPGIGTTLRLYFPAAETPGTAETSAHVEPATLDGTETVLVVEDEDLLRPLVARALAAHGYTVLTAADAHEALELAAGHAGRIDLLVTDVVMPGMNGRQLAEELQATRPDVEVVYTSGYPGDTVLGYGIAHGEVTYLEKPYLLDDLARTVRETLDLRNQ